jgi:hypothetical protein
MEMVPGGSVVPRFSSRYRHPLRGSHQQNKGYPDSQAEVNRRVEYYGLFYGSLKTPRLALCQSGSRGRTHISQVGDAPR